MYKNYFNYYRLCVSNICFLPENRKNKRLSYGKATLFDDFSLLPLLIESRVKPISPTFAIEIKPKQGWFPVSEQKFSKCLFCLKQHLKVRI